MCNCPAGERKLQCRTGEFVEATMTYNNVPTNPEYSVFCIDVDATDDDKEQACLDACNEWLADNSGALYCDFLPVSDPYEWGVCVAPGVEGTGSGTGAGLECPGWYAPHAKVSGYEPLTPSSATVQVDPQFLAQIIADPLSLYVCDSARYEEYEPGQWVFVEVEPSDLLHHLGVRSGDGIATVQGVDPDTHEATTTAHKLDSTDSMFSAYTALEQAEGVLLSVERTEVPGGVFEIWIGLGREE